MATTYRAQAAYLGKVYEVLATDYTQLAEGKARTFQPAQLSKMMDDLLVVAGNLATTAAGSNRAAAINTYLGKATASQIIAFLIAQKVTTLDATTLGAYSLEQLQGLFRKLVAASVSPTIDQALAS